MNIDDIRTAGIYAYKSMMPVFRKALVVGSELDEDTGEVRFTLRSVEEAGEKFCLTAADIYPESEAKPVVSRPVQEAMAAYENQDPDLMRILLGFGQMAIESQDGRNALAQKLTEQFEVSMPEALAVLETYNRQLSGGERTPKVTKAVSTAVIKDRKKYNSKSVRELAALCAFVMQDKFCKEAMASYIADSKNISLDEATAYLQHIEDTDLVLYNRNRAAEYADKEDEQSPAGDVKEPETLFVLESNGGGDDDDSLNDPRQFNGRKSTSKQKYKLEQKTDFVIKPEYYTHHEAATMLGFDTSTMSSWCYGKSIGKPLPRVGVSAADGTRYYASMEELVEHIYKYGGRNAKKVVEPLRKLKEADWQKARSNIHSLNRLVYEEGYAGAVVAAILTYERLSKIDKDNHSTRFPSHEKAANGTRVWKIKDLLAHVRKKPNSYAQLIKAFPNLDQLV